MVSYTGRLGLLLLVIPTILGLFSLQAATVTRQNAEVFSRKIVEILRQGKISERTGTYRTSFSEDEVNSWFTYTAPPLLPAGIVQLQVTIVGQGMLMGQAIVDLDMIAKRPSTGSGLDPWSFVGGRVPVSVAGLLQARDGVGRFEVQAVEISGVEIPTTLAQELVSYYSRSPELPEGLRLDDVFQLPANIKQIEVNQGQAVVVQ